MDVTTAELLEVAFEVVEAGAPPVPSDVGERVLAVAVAARPARHPGWGTAASGPLDAFLQTAAELARLLGPLAPADWSRPTRALGAPTVRELMVHLVGVEWYVLGQLGARPALDAPTRELHAPVTREAAAELLDDQGPDVARAWWRAVLEVAAVAGRTDPGQPAPYHHLPGDLRGLMIVRTFELWTHGDDIRAAVSRSLNPLDPSRLRLMSSELMAVLPIALAVTGGARPGMSARLELTGAGGGSYLVPLAPGEVPGDPALTISTPVIDLCRLAANRLPISDLPVRVTGDATAVDPILVGAGAFAMD